MKRILYIGGFNLPDNNAAAQRVIANAKLFSDLGYEVKLVGLTSTFSKANISFNYEGLECLNIKYPLTLKEWWQYLSTIKWYFPIITNFKPDIIIAYNHPALALYYFKKYCTSHHIIILSDCTEWYSPQGGFFFKIVKSLDVYLRMHIVHKQLDGMIVISQFLYDYYNNGKIPILLLPPLVDKQDVKWIHSQKENSCNDIKSCIRLTYAGSPGKGNKDRLDIIISALENVNKIISTDISLYIIGISEKQYRQIYDLDDGIVIPSFVNFMGKITHLDVLKHLSQTDFQIFIRENNRANTAGFPTKFVESMSSSVLVLTNITSDLNSYMSDGKNGFLLNISTKETLEQSLYSSLMKSPNEIVKLRNSIDSNLFDFRHYKEVTNHFFELLFLKF